MRGKRRTLKSMSNTFRKDRTTDELAEGGRAQRITGSADIVVLLVYLIVRGQCMNAERCE